MYEEQEDNLMMELLHGAYPGRTEEQIIPIGLVFCGVFWGRDYRFHAVPYDADGRPINGGSEGEEYHYYLSWLADHLYHLKAEPIEEQAGLCKWVAGMVPQDAMIFLGMETALYFTNVVEWMERWIEDDIPFPEYWQDKIEMNFSNNPDKIPDREDSRIEYERVKAEHKEHQQLCPDVNHADVPYRLPLAVALQKVENKKEREELLDIYYQNFNDYLQK